MGMSALVCGTYVVLRLVVYLTSGLFWVDESWTMQFCFPQMSWQRIHQLRRGRRPRRKFWTFPLFCGRKGPFSYSKLTVSSRPESWSTDLWCWSFFPSPLSPWKKKFRQKMTKNGLFWKISPGTPAAGYFFLLLRDCPIVPKNVSQKSPLFFPFFPKNDQKRKKKCRARPSAAREKNWGRASSPWDSGHGSNLGVHRVTFSLLELNKPIFPEPKLKTVLFKLIVGSNRSRPTKPLETHDDRHLQQASNALQVGRQWIPIDF